jgi:hypothetical protein
MPTIRVPQQYAAVLEEGLEVFGTRTGLKRTGVERLRSGGKNVAGITKRKYGKHYDGLYQFAAMIGAYGTCFALPYYAPDFCPSVDDDVIALYVMYKTEPKGTYCCGKISRQRKGAGRIPAIAIISCLVSNYACMDNKAVIGDKNWGNFDQFLSPITPACNYGKHNDDSTNLLQ